MASFAVTPVPVLRDNYAYLVADPAAGAVAAIDPGEAGPVLAALPEGGRLDWILLTHHHGDHTGGVEELRRATGARVAGPAAEAARLPPLDMALAEGETLALGEARAKVLEVPGHTKGHIAFHFEATGELFPGDTLFVMGCGRLLESDARTMWASLGKLMRAPDATRVWCGHEYTLANARFAATVDPDNPDLARRLAEVEDARGRGLPTVPSTMALEKATNPFLRAADPAIRTHLGLERAGDVEVFAELRRRKDRA